MGPCDTLFPHISPFFSNFFLIFRGGGGTQVKKQTNRFGFGSFSSDRAGTFSAFCRGIRTLTIKLETLTGRAFFGDD